MSSIDEQTTDILAELSLASSGVVAGVALAYAAIKTWSRFTSACSTLCKFCQAKDVPICHLRSFLSSDSSDHKSESSKEMLVIVRGIIAVKPKRWWSSTPNILVSQISRELGVVLEQTWACLPFTGMIAGLFGRPCNFEKKVSLKSVPFVLYRSGHWKYCDHVIINVEGSSHSLPLKVVYHELVDKNLDMRSRTSGSLTLGREILTEERMLPIGEEVSAVGICSLQDGNLQIKACEELPHFLSPLTRDQLVDLLATKRDFWFLGSIILGLLSLGAFSYALTRILQLCQTECKSEHVKDDDGTTQDTPDEQ